MLPTILLTALLVAFVISAAPSGPLIHLTTEVGSSQLDRGLRPSARDLLLLETRQGNCMAAPGPRPALRPFNDRASYHLIPVLRREDMNPVENAWIRGINDPARGRFPDGVQVQIALPREELDLAEGRTWESF